MAFIRRTYVDKTGSQSSYSLFLPDSYGAGRDWPAILFLHGAAESGADGLKQTKVGLGAAIARQQSTFPFVTVFPQSRMGGWRAGTPAARNALAILGEVGLLYGLDPRRIHLTGISMGGYGTWSIAAAHPDLWASIVPICGGGDPRKAAQISGIPCWAFHGDADDVIPVEESRAMVRALRAAGGNPHYTEFHNVGHNSWDLAYATPESFEWLARNVRPPSTPER